jgi:hypothetical protein
MRGGSRRALDEIRLLLHEHVTTSDAAAAIELC